jgi:membrane protease YdiL (CAAX protease family)
VAVSVLFACIHFHLPSAGPLFAMAAAFALAYAYTGSVVVPAVMHALFNGGTLVTLLVLRNASALHLLR